MQACATVCNRFNRGARQGACRVLPEALAEAGALGGSRKVILGCRNRERPVSSDSSTCRGEAAINRLKDFRRLASRYNRLAADLQSAVALAAGAAFRL